MDVGPRLGDNIIFIMGDSTARAAIVTRVWSDKIVNLTFFTNGYEDLSKGLEQMSYGHSSVVYNPEGLPMTGCYRSDYYKGKN